MPKKYKVKKYREVTAGDQILRIPLPKDNQVLGIIETRLGYGKSRVICTDGKTRICRVPGSLTRRIWPRADRVVLVQPWEEGGDKKGNIIYQYTKNQVNWLKNNNYLKGIIEKEEF